MSKLLKFFLFGFLFLCFANNTFAQEKKQELNWLSFEEMQAKQLKQPKKVLVDVYADWCVWCKALDLETFNEPAIAAYLNKNYYLVKFNPQDAGQIKYKGKNYDLKYFKYTNSSKSRRVNALAIELMDVDFIYPSIIFLDEKLETISVFKGFKNAKDIDPILSYFASNSYLKQKWSLYIKNYKSILVN